VRWRTDPALVGVLALAGLAWVGQGYYNGDIAAYCAQAWSGDLHDRVVHVGYTTLAWALGVISGRALPWSLDVVNVLCAGLGAAAATRLADRTGDRAAVGLAAVALLLPWAPFAEVDVPWIALVLAAAAGLPGAAAAAVAISPTALLALPWVAMRRGGPGPLIEGALAVAALTALSGGGWWWGDRGVLQPRPLLIGRNLGSWLATVPWLVVLTGSLRPLPRSLGGLAPLLLAPADVPAAPLVSIAAVAAALDHRARDDLARTARVGALVWLVVGGVVATERRAERVAEEHVTILRVLRRLAPGDGLVAPFTWGARAAVIATGDPYGLPWHPPGRFLRDQRAGRQHVDGVVRVLPPGPPATSPLPEPP